jgi:hypothetical protein
LFKILKNILGLVFIFNRNLSLYHYRRSEKNDFPTFFTPKQIHPEKCMVAAAAAAYFAED